MRLIKSCVFPFSTKKFRRKLNPLKNLKSCPFLMREKEGENRQKQKGQECAVTPSFFWHRLFIYFFYFRDRYCQCLGCYRNFWAWEMHGISRTKRAGCHGRHELSCAKRRHCCSLTRCSEALSHGRSCLHVSPYVRLFWSLSLTSVSGMSIGSSDFALLRTCCETWGHVWHSGNIMKFLKGKGERKKKKKTWVT